MTLEVRRFDYSGPGRIAKIVMITRLLVIEI